MSSASPAAPAVFDASAVLALLFDEPGASTARAHLRGGVLGAANLAEVLAKLSDHGMPAPQAIQAVSLLALTVMSMTDAQARHSAALRAATRPAGLSLGDRACLALAAELGGTALTADRGWTTVAVSARVSVLVIR